MSREDKIKEILRKKRERFPIDGMRTHQACVAKYGVARPGKTYADKLKRGEV